LFRKIKKGQFARRFFKKNSVFSRLKLFNKHYSKMTFFISVLSVVYCGGGEISPTVKPNSRSWLEAQPMFPFSWWVMWKEF
jgi:hypothetical protein